MATPTCISPAVMQRPNDLNIRPIQVFKEEFVIQPMVMDIMKMNYIRFNLLYPTKELLGSTPRSQPFTIKQTMFRVM
jgi:hypothetical protein